MIDQTDFLGHQNFNGHTTSMRDLQKVQQDFWTAAYIAQARQGSAPAYSANMADAALKMFNERFVPNEVKPDELRC